MKSFKKFFEDVQGPLNRIEIAKKQFAAQRQKSIDARNKKKESKKQTDSKDTSSSTTRLNVQKTVLNNINRTK